MLHILLLCALSTIYTYHLYIMPTFDVNKSPTLRYIKTKHYAHENKNYKYDANVISHSI